MLLGAIAGAADTPWGDWDIDVLVLLAIGTLLGSFPGTAMVLAVIVTLFAMHSLVRSRSRDETALPVAAG
jgi:hypothetical protein